MADERDSAWQTPPQLWERLKPLAQEMRRAPTPGEDRLWQALRRRQIDGFRFRRQHALGQFIVDFYCARARLVIEVDGPVHQYVSDQDRVRQDFLERLGLQVLRFTNDQVAGDLQNVLAAIGDALTLGTSPPAAATPSPPAERGTEGER